MDLCDLSVIRALLDEHGLRMQKSLGQNFLIDPEVPRRIAGSVGEADEVLEIGPGIGCLTAELCRAHPRVTAVELDAGLIPVLAKTLAEFDNVRVIHGDILKTDLPALFSPGSRVAVCANLPYYITTPILMELIASPVPFVSLTVMVQAEVAARFTAPPGGRDYGAVTVALGAYGTVKKLFSVSAGHFYPAPKVDSAVVQIVPRETPLLAEKERPVFRSVVRAAFEKRRKTLANALASLPHGRSKEELGAILSSLGFPADVRGERLSPEDYASLARALFPR